MKYVAFLLMISFFWACSKYGYFLAKTGPGTPTATMANRKSSPAFTREDLSY